MLFLSSKNKKTIAVIALLALCVGVAFFVGTHTKQDSSNLQRVSGSELLILKEQWEAVIKDVGGAEAYGQFLEQAPQNESVDTHTQAHLFGEALYDVEGLDGIRFCDSSFEFGCYHSFFGVAVYEEGIGVLPKFDQACMDAYGGGNLPCQHGIGHGVLVYTGYDKLEEALGLCETISWQSTGGCSSGVFMEYNFHTMESTEVQEYLRPLEDDVYAPCNTLPSKHQPSCYLEQVQWWENIFGHDYEKIGLLCSELPNNTDVYRACFHGVGNYAAAYAKLDPKSITPLCKQMPSQESAALCHEGASWLVRGDGSSIEKARMVCEASPEGYVTGCLQKLR